MPYSPDFLKSLRTQKGWTIRDVAEKAGVAPGSVHGAEKGKNPGIQTIAKILRVFGLEIQLVKI